MRGRRLPSTLLLVGATAVHSHLSCPPGFELWHGDNLCYAFAAGPATQTFAQAYCGSFNNGRLACPSTREVVDFIAERAGSGGHDLWIGWSDTLHEGSWICPPTALAQVNESWLPWCVGEPNNGGGGSQSRGTPDGGDCVRVVGHEGGKCPVGTWADYRCDASHGPQHGTDLAEFGFVCSSTPTSERRRGRRQLTYSFVFTRSISGRRHPMCTGYSMIKQSQINERVSVTARNVWFLRLRQTVHRMVVRGF